MVSLPMRRATAGTRWGRKTEGIVHVQVAIAFGAAPAYAVPGNDRGAVHNLADLEADQRINNLKVEAGR